MGTNYYIIRKANRETKKKFHEMIDKEQFEELQNELYRFEKKSKIHVGKSSCGWKFLFDANNFQYYDKNEESVWKWLKDNESDLYNEYGEKISFDDFKEMVESKQNGMDYMNYQIKYNEPDPYLTISDYYIGNLRFSSSTDFS